MKHTLNGVEYEVRTKKCDGTPKLVTFGKRGHTIHFARKFEYGGYSSSREEGYDDPENFFEPSKWWAHTWMERRDIREFEGCAWVNMREAVETDQGFKMAVSGPMVNVDLADGEIDRCPQPSEMMATAMMSEPGNQFGQLLALQGVSRAKREKIGPLDSICISAYLQAWKEVGAMVGRIINGQFVQE